MQSETSCGIYNFNFVPLITFLALNYYYYKRKTNHRQLLFLTSLLVMSDTFTRVYLCIKNYLFLITVKNYHKIPYTLPVSIVYVWFWDNWSSTGHSVGTLYALNLYCSSITTECTYNYQPQTQTFSLFKQDVDKLLSNRKLHRNR